MYLFNVRLVNLLEEARGKSALITSKPGWMSKTWTRRATGGIWIYGDMDQVKYLNNACWNWGERLDNMIFCGFLIIKKLWFPWRVMTVFFFALLQFPMLVLVLDLNGSYSLQPELTTSETPSHFPEFLALPSSSDLEAFAYIYFTKFLPGRQGWENHMTHYYALYRVARC